MKTLDTNVAVIQETQSTVDVAVLQNEVDNLKAQIIEVAEFDTGDLWFTIDELEDKLDDLETRDAIMENEMRTIMSDHNGFSEVLKELNLSGYGDTRAYGDYK